MKKLSQRGEGSMVIIGLVALVGIGIAIYFAYKQGQAHSLTLPTPSPSASPAKVQLTHFKSEVNSLSFDYPSTWKSTIKVNASDPTDKSESGTITSPDGMVIHYSNPATGLGGACADDCPTTTHTFSKELHKFNAASSAYIASQKIYNPKSPESGFTRRLGLIQGDQVYSFQQDYVGAPPYPVFCPTCTSLGPDSSLILLYADYLASAKADARDSLSDTAYFATPSMKAALTIFRSVKY